MFAFYLICLSLATLLYSLDCGLQLNTVEVDYGPAPDNIFKSRSRGRCVIGNLNINSLPSKWLEVLEWIRSFDILSIQETKIDSTFPKSQFSLQGYNTCRRDREKGGGGIQVYVGNSIPSYQIKTKCGEVEAMLIDIQRGQQHFSLSSVYKPPSVKSEIFTKEMSVLLDLAILNRQDVISVWIMANKEENCWIFALFMIFII